MNAAISNIAWQATQDPCMYDLMTRLGIRGLEIAPTRFFPEEPYNRLADARELGIKLEKAGICIPSMQSIWYGRTESLFGTEEERRFLEQYTKSAIDFAAAIRCRNLVFGCPRNRNVPDGRNPEELIPFLRRLAEYAASKGCVIGIEANPPIYHTNYINTTAEALELIREINSPGFGLNLDVGTMMCQGESVDLLKGHVTCISHVHISEPGLKPVVPHPLHKELIALLKDEHYTHFVSLEMGRGLSVPELEVRLLYLKQLCS